MICIITAAVFTEQIGRLNKEKGLTKMIPLTFKSTVLSVKNAVTDGVRMLSGCML